MGNSNCCLSGSEASEENARGKLLERSFPLDSFQELSKNVIYKYFFKVFGDPRTFFKKRFLAAGGRAPNAPINPNLNFTQYNTTNTIMKGMIL